MNSYQNLRRRKRFRAVLQLKAVVVFVATCLNVKCEVWASVFDHQISYLKASRQKLASYRDGLLNRRQKESHGHARSSCSDAVEILKEHIAKTTPISDFYIQGWRWHTLSLIRESNRLSQAAAAMRHRRSSSTSEDLLKAAEYVVNFNMRGLHRIESELFFPWIVKRPSVQEQSREIIDSLHTVMRDLDTVRENVKKHGAKLVRVLSLVQWCLVLADGRSLSCCFLFLIYR